MQVYQKIMQRLKV